MSTAAMEAQRLVNEMLRWESRGAGDTENAMRRLGNRHGIPWRVFWTMKYRTPKDLFVSVFEEIKAAHKTEAHRQLRKVQYELQIAEINGVYVRDLADQVEALAHKLESRLANRNEG